jgi:NAD(P)-dependent dehydrogenase (short-subunit alcohol dehydrogenase family)
MLLADKVAVVSGIGPGLGQELALAAAREGAHVAICARTRSRLDDVAAAVVALGHGTKVVARATDITVNDQVVAFVDEVIEQLGRVDVLINSGYTTGSYQLAAEADLDDWRRTMDVNLFGTMQVIQAVVPHMRAQGGGSIVNVNTKVARMVHELMGGYAVSKAALRMATTQLAKELGRDHIRVNSVFPGWMWGATVEQGLQAQADATGRTLTEVRAEIAARLPLGDIPDDADCARAIVALASDHFRTVTGACLDLSSGEYMPL